MILEKEATYWERFYMAGGAPVEPSLFAQYVLKNYFKQDQSLIEFGCGNGRDAHYFAENGVEVRAVDQCEQEIQKLVETNGRLPNLHYASGDFTQLPDHDGELDIVYSRFTLHSVSAVGQADALNWSYRNLAAGGILCVETRGQKNELYKKGEPVEGQEDAFIYEGHYRRFVDFTDFTDQIRGIGFKIIEAAESAGFAPYKDTDYQFIRVIAEK